MIRTVTGRHNPSLKLARKLQKKKYRAERGYFLAEGWDVVAAAVDAGALPAELLVREDLAGRLPVGLRAAAERDQLDVVICPADVLAEASLLGGAADVVAVFPSRPGSLGDWEVGRGLTVYLHGVGDPGNVGTLVRAAAAFGAGGVGCSPGTADPFGPRALRAGMGAQFLIPIAVEVEPEHLEAHVTGRVSRGEPAPLLLVADSRGGTDSWDVAVAVEKGCIGERGAGGGGADWGGGVILALGSERGALPHFAGRTLRVRIPQMRFDSLNVAMAGSILLYELRRGAAPHCAWGSPRL
ncbi:MAG: RNA methyltransferase [Gaiellales bacterium]|nr:RNA methyltransferase [Gaiellales bacterium]